ncbi:MAG: alanine racemase, partial [Patescibacteria group bacterium]
EFVVYSEKTLRYLAKYGKRSKIHLFYNSGMNREGVKDLKKFLELNQKYLDKISLVGFCSHLSSAEEKTVLNQAQEDKFFRGLLLLREAGYFPTWIHLGNSASALTNNNSLLTAYRPGLALYGYNPLSEEDDNNFYFSSKLQPALRVTSSVVFVQNLEANEPVSYNSSYRAREKTNIAIVPFGYFEGLDRRLSNQGEFLIHDFWAQIAGKVCMNITCLDVGQNNVRIGDRVLLISSDPSAPNSVMAIASLMNTISYEVLVKLQASIHREIVWK